MHTRSILVASALLLAALGCRDQFNGPTEPRTTPGAEVAEATVLAFSQISTGGFSSCGVTPDSIPYCWGLNNLGQLGQGTDVGPEICYDFPCSERPIAVSGSLRFRNLSVGGDHACGLTATNRVYCWGNNRYGSLGVGTNAGPEACVLGAVACSTWPIRVLGGLSFRQVSAGVFTTCGVTTDYRAYCWGYNYSGQLGIGTTQGPELCGTEACSTRPLAVVGGLRFRSVSVGGGHVCGITTAQQAYCWGDNRYGQLGDSTERKRRVRPVRVAGGRAFRQLTAGGTHSCGVTTANVAFCWGDGLVGQLGNGKTYLSFWPRRVAGELSFERVTAGYSFTCGETTTNRAYCWGLGDALGNDDPYSASQSKPVAVAGGLYFKQVDARGDHACGKTSAATVYCWGPNYYGQLGDGTLLSRTRPTAVVGAP